MRVEFGLLQALQISLKSLLEELWLVCNSISFPPVQLSPGADCCSGLSSRTCSSDVALLAELWLKKRTELGHPLGVAVPQQLVGPGKPAATMNMDSAELLIEIGCEELPPADIRVATQQLRSAFKVCNISCGKFAMLHKTHS